MVQIRKLVVMVDQPRSDSGEMRPDSQVNYWQRRAFEADERASLAEASAKFYAGCAMLFFITFVVGIVVWALI